MKFEPGKFYIGASGYHWIVWPSAELARKGGELGHVGSWMTEDKRLGRVIQECEERFGVSGLYLTTLLPRSVVLVKELMFDCACVMGNQIGWICYINDENIDYHFREFVE